MKSEEEKNLEAQIATLTAELNAKAQVRLAEEAKVAHDAAVKAALIKEAAKKVATVEISNKVAELEKLSKEILELAKEHEIDVRLNLDGKRLSFDPEETSYYGNTGWLSSSDRC